MGRHATIQMWHVHPRKVQRLLSRRKGKVDLGSQAVEFCHSAVKVLPVVSQLATSDHREQIIRIYRRHRWFHWIQQFLVGLYSPPENHSLMDGDRKEMAEKHEMQSHWHSQDNLRILNC